MVACSACGRQTPEARASCQYCGARVQPGPASQRPSGPVSVPAPEPVVRCDACRTRVPARQMRCYRCSAPIAQPSPEALREVFATLVHPGSSPWPQAQAVASEGLALFEAGLLKEARERGKKAAMLAPKLAFASVVQGVSALSAGDYIEGLAQLDHALSLDPAYPGLREAKVRLAVLRGEILARKLQEDPGKSSMTMGAVTPAPPPTAADIARHRARSYLAWAAKLNQQQRFSEALARLEEAGQIDPAAQGLVAPVVHVQCNLRHFDAARGAIARARAAGPSPSLDELATRVDEAERLAASGEPHAVGFDFAPSIDPRARELRARASRLDDAGQLEQSLAVYDLALALDPLFADALCERGYVLRKLGKVDEALAAYDRCLDVDPFHLVALSNKGNALLARQRWAEALDCYDEVLALDPDHQQVIAPRDFAFCAARGVDEETQREALALAAAAAQHRAEGNIDEALAGYDAALALNPQSAVAWYNHGNACSTAGQWADAFASWSRAVELDPRAHKAWVNRGLALEELGLPDEARASYEQALALFPANASARRRLANLGTRGQGR